MYELQSLRRARDAHTVAHLHGHPCLAIQGEENGIGMFGKTQLDPRGVTDHHGAVTQGMGTDGVMRMDSTDGCTMGPPADMEYAVEPVGVATIKPSAR